MDTRVPKKEEKQSIPLKGLLKLHSQVYKKPHKTTVCIINYIVIKV